MSIAFYLILAILATLSIFCVMLANLSFKVKENITEKERFVVHGIDDDNCFIHHIIRKNKGEDVACWSAPWKGLYH
ncbi:MAG: hypothetical protein ACMUIA_11610 [bacterium]